MHTTQIAQIHGTKGEIEEQITNPSAESSIRLASPPVTSSRSIDRRGRRHRRFRIHAYNSKQLRSMELKAEIDEEITNPSAESPRRLASPLRAPLTDEEDKTQAEMKRQTRGLRSKPENKARLQKSKQQAPTRQTHMSDTEQSK